MSGYQKGFYQIWKSRQAEILRVCRCSLKCYFIFSDSSNNIFSDYNKSQCVIYVLYLRVHLDLLSHMDYRLSLIQESRTFFGLKRFHSGFHLYHKWIVNPKGVCLVRWLLLVGILRSHFYPFNSFLIIDSFSFNFSLYVNNKTNLQSLSDNFYAKSN